MDEAQAQALIRFGLGRRGGEALPADPRAWLRAQVTGPDRADFSDLPDTASGLAADRADRAEHKADPLSRPTRARDAYRADAAAQLANLVQAQAPFRERLVLFWANHFTVSMRQAGVAAILGSFVREAIRPHVTGRFADMALAVMRHPAMLIYLQNMDSVGPDSPAGAGGRRGLNENLAREFMELHTVGLAAGYTQADVTAFARVITGWSVEREREPLGFVFRPRAHQPGPKTVMGHSFAEGEAGGVAAVRFLATHPATWGHLARLLAAAFVADRPSGFAVARLAAVLRDTGGDLGAASLALIDLPEAWRPLTKLRPPVTYMVAALRAVDLPADLPPPRRPDPAAVLAGLGQPLWNAPQPNGWPETSAEWAAPDALLLRMEWAYNLAGRLPGADAELLAETALGPFLRPQTREAIRHAGSRRDALTLALSSPEFLRC